MKVVLLAGGFGTRISEESGVRPKPMVEIGGMPILWHIMKIYAHYGITDFIICCGYKGNVIKDFFSNYFVRMSDVVFDMAKNKMEVLNNNVEPWTVTLVDTGENTMTGGRIRRVQQYIGNETFCLTYGDGVSSVNIKELIEFHKKNNKLVTLSAVQQPGRFGAFTLREDQNTIDSFREKPKGGETENAWINGGFFVVEPKALNYITDDATVWEREPLEILAKTKELGAYRHTGFWQPMDTLRDKQVLENMWLNNNAPWKCW
jgi:glucose-1-phosphate cytidylyltransferase